MDAKAIEEYAVDAVRDCLNYSDHLSSFIAEDDKEPSWDGHIGICLNQVLHLSKSPPNRSSRDHLSRGYLPQFYCNPYHRCGLEFPAPWHG